MHIAGERAEMGANVPLLEMQHERKYYQHDGASVMLSDARRGQLPRKRHTIGSGNRQPLSRTIRPVCLSGLSGSLWGMR